MLCNKLRSGADCTFAVTSWSRLQFETPRESGFRGSWLHAPLHQADKIGSKGYLELMLKSADIDINIRDNEGKTPLFLAVEEGRRDGVQILLDRGAHPNLPDDDGISPLPLAVERESTNPFRSEDFIAIISLLLEHGAEPPHKITTGGREPIQVGPRIDQRLRVLLQSQTTRTRAHDASEDENLPLAAAEDGRNSATSLLLQKGVSVEARNRDQETPLILAAKGEHQCYNRSLGTQARTRGGAQTAPAPAPGAS
jgi:ankyrin repeat protein